MSAPDARRRSDDAVRRIRDESARRIGGQRRRRAISSWCALAALGAGISLAGIDAHERALQERAELASAREAARMRAAAEEEARRARAAEACAKQAVAVDQIYRVALATAERARSAEEKARVFAEAMTRRDAAINDLVAAGCRAWVPAPPRMSRRGAGVESKDHSICGGLRRHPMTQGHVIHDDPFDGLNF